MPHIPALIAFSCSNISKCSLREAIQISLTINTPISHLGRFQACRKDLMADWHTKIHQREPGVKSSFKILSLGT